MTIDFYYFPASPPCVSTMIVAKVLGIELNEISVNLMKGEHLNEEFLQINPHHIIPTIVDDGFALWESRAVLIYLTEKAENGADIYPTDPQTRAEINRMLFFDSGTLYPTLLAYFYMLRRGEEDPLKKEKVDESLKKLELYLTDKKWTVGDSFTLADISMCPGVAFLEPFGFDMEEYPNIRNWLEACQAEIPGIEAIETAIGIQLKAMKK